MPHHPLASARTADLELSDKDARIEAMMGVVKDGGGRVRRTSMVMLTDAHVRRVSILTAGGNDTFDMHMAALQQEEKARFESWQDDMEKKMAKESEARLNRWTNAAELFDKQIAAAIVIQRAVRKWLRAMAADAVLNMGKGARPRCLEGDVKARRAKSKSAGGSGAPGGGRGKGTRISSLAEAIAQAVRLKKMMDQAEQWLVKQGEKAKEEASEREARAGADGESRGVEVAGGAAEAEMMQQMGPAPPAAAPPEKKTPGKLRRNSMVDLTGQAKAPGASHGGRGSPAPGKPGSDHSGPQAPRSGKHQARPPVQAAHAPAKPPGTPLVTSDIATGSPSLGNSAQPAATDSPACLATTGRDAQSTPQAKLYATPPDSLHDDAGPLMTAATSSQPIDLPTSAQCITSPSSDFRTLQDAQAPQLPSAFQCMADELGVVHPSNGVVPRGRQGGQRASVSRPDNGTIGTTLSTPLQPSLEVVVEGSLSTDCHHLHQHREAGDSQSSSLSLAKKGVQRSKELPSSKELASDRWQSADDDCDSLLDLEMRSHLEAADILTSRTAAAQPVLLSPDPCPAPSAPPPAGPAASVRAGVRRHGRSSLDAPTGLLARSRLASTTEPGAAPSRTPLNARNSNALPSAKPSHPTGSNDGEGAQRALNAPSGSSSAASSRVSGPPDSVASSDHARAHHTPPQQLSNAPQPRAPSVMARSPVPPTQARRHAASLEHPVLAAPRAMRRKSQLDLSAAGLHAAGAMSSAHSAPLPAHDAYSNAAPAAYTAADRLLAAAACDEQPLLVAQGGRDRTSVPGVRSGVAAVAAAGKPRSQSVMAMAPLSTSPGDETRQHQATKKPVSRSKTSLALSSGPDDRIASSVVAKARVRRGSLVSSSSPSMAGAGFLPTLGVGATKPITNTAHTGSPMRSLGAAPTAAKAALSRPVPTAWSSPVNSSSQVQINGAVEADASTVQPEVAVPPSKGAAVPVRLPRLGRASMA